LSEPNAARLNSLHSGCLSRTSSESDALLRSVIKVAKWVEDHHYEGYEPFEGNSSYLHRLTFGNELLERLLQQFVLRFPFNVRPAMGIKPKPSTKGRGYMAWGYLHLHEVTQDALWLEKAESMLDWLDRNKAERFPEHSWANHFSFTARGGRYTSEEPIIVWTALIGQAYVAAFEQTGNERWLRIADSACQWISMLPRERTTTGDCLSYLAGRQSSIHNANMLGAALLATVHKHTRNEEYARIAAAAAEYTCSRQLPDGSWWYAEPANYHWIDSFHTGYVLDSLKRYRDAIATEGYADTLMRGYHYFRNTFIGPNGVPRYYSDGTYPIDSQSAAQIIDTLALFSDIDADAIRIATSVAEWTISNMQGTDGHFYHRVLRWKKVRTPMLHWAQATMFKALSLLLLVRSDRNTRIS
jgi:hypothetical protein